MLHLIRRLHSYGIPGSGLPAVCGQLLWRLNCPSHNKLPTNKPKPTCHVKSFVLIFCKANFMIAGPVHQWTILPFTRFRASVALFQFFVLIWIPNFTCQRIVWLLNPLTFFHNQTVHQCKKHTRIGISTMYFCAMFKICNIFCARKWKSKISCTPV